jgi:Flp pilus assembly protein TadG
MIRLRSLRTDDRGVSVIEFAMFAPVIATMIIGITDVARAYSCKLMLESAVQRTLEKASVSPVQDDYSYLSTEAATAAGVSASSVSVTSWLECDGVRQTSFNGECAATQMITRYVQVQVTSAYQPLFSWGLFGRALFATNSSGQVPMTVRSAVRVQ